MPITMPTEDIDGYWYGLTLVLSFQDHIEKLVLRRPQDCGGLSADGKAKSCLCEKKIRIESE